MAKKTENLSLLDSENIIEEPFNCLQKKKIIVRFLPKQTGIIKDKNHVIYGGMADNAKRSFVVRKTESNTFVKFLTEDEQRCLEQKMGLQPGDLNPEKEEKNFFEESNIHGLSRVWLTKGDNVFDLSNPRDYISYKLLLTNSDIIAKSITEIQERNLPTYQFVVIDEETEKDNVASKLNNKKQAWIELGKIQDSIDSLRIVLSVFERKMSAPTTKIGYLQDRVVDYVDTDPKTFLKIVKDKYFQTKVTIQKAVDRGIIIKRGTYYYDKETNTPLCENGEDPTLTNACKYLNSVKNDSIKFSIEQKISKS